MINYLTTKNRLLVAILAFILPFSFARAEAKKDGKTISQGCYSFRDFIKRERFYIYLLLASIFIFLTNLLYFLE